MIKKNDLNFLIIFQMLQIITLYEDIPAWVLAVSLCTYILQYLKIKVSKIILKTITLSSMAVVILYYRSLFIPESAVSLLVMAGSFKILEIETKRDVFISLLISILFLSAIAIFSVSLNAFIFMVIFLLITIGFWAKIFNDDIFSIKDILKYLSKILLLTLPFTILLFVFFPRFSTHFFPFRSTVAQSSVGFNDSVKNSEITSLNPSSKIAFRVNMKNYPLNQSQLYWRGTVHLQTNGYDWEPNTILSSLTKSTTPEVYPDQITYEVQYGQQFKGIYFTLENALSLTVNDQKYAPLNDLRLFQANSFIKIENYQATSKLNLQNLVYSKSRDFNYLQLPKNIPLAIQNLASTIVGSEKDANKIANLIGQYLQNNNFQYSLNPGKINSLEEFISIKKGFCTHYASLSAIILRLNKIPTRLVSGFQGGEYNQIGDYWIIRDNDAHTWVEFFDEKYGWKLFDPVEFVSPARLTRGGELFFSTQPTFLSSNSSFLNGPYKYYLKLKLHLDNYNYKWKSFIESFDKSYQEKLASIFNIKLNKFYILIAIGFMFLIFFYYQIINLNFTFKINQLLEEKYYKNLVNLASKKRNKPILLTNTINQNIQYFQLENCNDVCNYFKMYSDIKYGSKTHTKNNISKLYLSAKKELNLI